MSGKFTMRGLLMRGRVDAVVRCGLPDTYLLKMGKYARHGPTASPYCFAITLAI